MDTLDTFLKNKKESNKPVYFVLSGIVISGKIEEFGEGVITLSEVFISGEKYLGITTIPAKNILAWGDGMKYK